MMKIGSSSSILLVSLIIAVALTPLATAHQLQQNSTNTTIDDIYTINGTTFIGNENTTTGQAAILAFEGFVFGFLGDTADPIETCMLQS